MRGIARPYAQALLSVAGSLEKAAAVRDELAEFQGAVERVPALRELATNPALPLDAKRRALDRLVERMGLDALTRRLLHALLSRYRLGRLAEVVAGISEELHRRQGIAVAEVETAEALADEERRELQRVLEANVGKRLEMRLAVNPGLLAGFVARVDSQLFDGSLRGQLARLERELAEA